MKATEMIKSRYTTKLYDGSYEMEDSVRDAIVETLRYSPSSINSQPWKFYVVQNKEVKNKLAEVSPEFNIEKIKDCGLFIVFTGLKADVFEARLREVGYEIALWYFDNVIKPKGVEGIECWINEQVYLSLGFLMSSLGYEGIDSTPMEGINIEKYEEILGVDKSKERVLFALAIGKRSEDDKNQPSITPKTRFDKEVTVTEIL